jgi:hypothetical protein
MDEFGEYEGYHILKGLLELRFDRGVASFSDTESKWILECADATLYVQVTDKHIIVRLCGHEWHDPDEEKFFLLAAPDSMQKAREHIDKVIYRMVFEEDLPT